MAETIQDIANAWAIDEPKYQILGRHVSDFIKRTITEYEILPEVSFRTKELLSIIKKINKKVREKTYSYSHLNDKLGLRIICTFQEDMGKVDQFISQYFIVKKVEYKQQDLDFNKLDYISNHYDLSINPAIKEFSKLAEHSALVFELQVRTLNQHSWSNTAHSLSYKQETDIPPALKRRIYRLLSLYEIADDEFSAVNKALIEHPDSKVYALLKKLESKIYRYAQVDYDRDTSLFTIRILLGYFSEEEIQSISSGIEEFISDNQTKIQNIFNENRARFFEMPLLTQPEVFILWFALEKFPFSLEDNWQNDFDQSDLEQIETLWGKTIS